MIVGRTTKTTPITVAPLVIAPKAPDAEKLSTYECGFNAFDDARMKFDVRFYLVSILFIIFDLEVAFLFPWAIVLRELEGLSYEEIAATMDCPVGTVRSRIFRAREAIDGRLREVFEGGLGRAEEIG